MASAATNARMKFLASSARLYSSIAPETSAHLMLESYRCAAENDLSPKQAKLPNACKACGTLFLPDLTTQTSIIEPYRFRSSQLKSRKKKTHTGPKESKTLVSQCSVCRRRVTSSPYTSDRCDNARNGTSKIQAVFSIGSQSSGPGLDLLHHVNPETQTSSSSQNLSSKKRAKARKQGNLQNLLARSKTADIDSSHPGLDLMDLMKRS